MKGWLDTFDKAQTGASLPGATGMMYSRSSTLDYTKKAQDGDKFKKDLYEKTRVKIDNTAVKKPFILPILSKEQIAEKAEKKAEEIRRNQPVFSSDDRSPEERKAAIERADQVKNANLSIGEKLLPYLANPFRAIGDVVEPMINYVRQGNIGGSSGWQHATNPFPTTQEIAQEVELNRTDPNLNWGDKLLNKTKIGLGEVPAAAINLVTGAAFAPTGSGVKGMLNYALNPIAGTNSTISPIINKLKKDLKASGRKFVAKNIPRKVNTLVEGTDMTLITNSKIGELFDKTGIPKALGWERGFNYGPNSEGRKFVASASNPGKDVVDLSSYTDEVGKYFSFENAFVKNPMTAGRTMKAMENVIPKYGIIKQNPASGSLSQDSFNMMVQRLKNPSKYKDVTNYGDDYIFLNRLANSKRMINPITGKPHITNRTLKDQNLFDGVELNALEKKYSDVFNKLSDKGIVNGEYKGLTNRAIKIPGLADDVYQIGIPNISLKKLYKDGGWLSKYENGGVIEDDRGQWAHPGEVTKINSNNITMKGVNYPVLGVSNTGDEQLMMPGENYKFDGKSVTEYPIIKNGGWLSKYN